MVFVIGAFIIQVVAFLILWFGIVFTSKIFGDDVDIFPSAFVMAVIIWFITFMWGSFAAGILVSVGS